MNDPKNQNYQLDTFNPTPHLDMYDERIKDLANEIKCFFDSPIEENTYKEVQRHAKALYKLIDVWKIEMKLAGA